MNRMPFLIVIIIVWATVISTSSFAAEKRPLFINQTSSESHRSTMAIGFGANQLKRGHPLTIFFNDHGVQIVSKQFSRKYQEQQSMVQELVKAGATIYVCPSCMKKHNIKESDLLPGLKVSNPELTEAALFKEGTQTLSW